MGIVRRLVVVGAGAAVAFSLAAVGPADPVEGAPPAPSLTAVKPSSGWTLQTTFPGLLSSVSCATHNRCFAAGADGSIEVSDNGGASWTSSQVAPLIAGIQAISCQAGTCVAAGEGPQGTESSATSTDRGRTWESEEATSVGDPASLACSSASDCAVVGQQSEVTGSAPEAAYTTDGGTTWSPGSLPSPPSALNSVSCAGSDCTAVGSTISQYAAKVSIVGTTDGGVTWHDDTVPTDFYPESVACLSAGACDALGYGQTGMELAVTADDGSTWTMHAIPNVTPTTITLACSGARRCLVVSQGTSDGELLAEATTDGGSTWTAQTMPSLGPDLATVYSASCPSSSRCVVAAEDNGVGALVSTKNAGTTWSETFSGLAVGALDTVACAPGGDRCWSSYGGYLFDTTDGGRSWTQSPYLDGGEDMTCVDDQHCWSVGADGPDTGIIDATSDGVHWSTQYRADSSTLTSISCADVEHCWAVGFGVTGYVGASFATTDGGATWTALPLRKGMLLTSISCPTDPFCVANEGAGAPYYSTDGGMTWKKGKSSKSLSDVDQVDCVSPTECLAATDGEVALSTDQGRRWVVTATATGVNYPLSVSCANAEDCAVAGSSAANGTSAIAATTDGGTTWISQSVPGEFSAPGSTLNAVSCAASSGCLAVGGIGPSGGGVAALPSFP
jgi:photosystem II stability/assembly factor-like uncharacterized protein